MVPDPIDALRVEPGAPADLERRDPAARLWFPPTGKDDARAHADALTTELAELQRRLYAEGTRSVLLVLQGLDASGKDGTIRRVFSGVNPQGCRVASFKVPSHRELAHDYLWRVHAECPARGMLGIFNRSHYEDVVTTYVLGLVDDRRRRRRLRQIRAFERALAEEGTTIVKVYLHISRDEQRDRLQARLDDPRKRWKLRPDDLETRRRWHDHVAAYERALTATSTTWAPWWVVPADRKWVRDVAVGELLVRTLRTMDPQPPPPDPRLDGVRVE